jgi:hypothetical protein
MLLVFPISNQDLKLDNMGGLTAPVFLRNCNARTSAKNNIRRRDYIAKGI